MKIIRGILGGIAFSIISGITSLFTYLELFSKWTEQINHLLRPMESLQMRFGMLFAEVITGLTVAFIYAILHKGIPGTGIKKGLNFGLIIWLVWGFAGELYWYMMSPIPIALMFIGWFESLMVLSLGGIAIAAIYGKSLR